jgi:predicted RNA-binding protein YlxR (DUF448 family)
VAKHDTPERTCVGCRRRFPQPALTRWVLGADGDVVCSRTAAGRGAWVCTASRSCYEQALQRHGFERSWKRTVGPETSAALRNACTAMTTNMEN